MLVQRRRLPWREVTGALSSIMDIKMTAMAQEKDTGQSMETTSIKAEEEEVDLCKMVVEEALICPSASEGAITPREAIWVPKEVEIGAGRACHEEVPQVSLHFHQASDSAESGLVARSKPSALTLLLSSRRSSTDG